VRKIIILAALFAAISPAFAAPHLNANQKKFGCSISYGQLFCPSPDTTRTEIQAARRSRQAASTQTESQPEGPATVNTKSVLAAALAVAAFAVQPAGAGGFVLCNDLGAGSRVCTSSDGGSSLENDLGHGATVGSGANGETWLRNRSGGLDVMTGDLPGFMSGEE
jgi:hypothetical protein